MKRCLLTVMVACGLAAATAAEALGYKNIKHLSAGISGWLQAGEKTEKAN